MAQFSVQDAKANLSQLIATALAGGEVIIDSTSLGKTLARLGLRILI